MSAWIASATPGYWIFTATFVPSSSRASWTCPIDAAASAVGENHAKTSLAGAPNSASTTSSSSSVGIGGASASNAPSERVYRSRYRSGTTPTSMKDRSWPIFMSAPFMSPSSLA